MKIEIKIIISEIIKRIKKNKWQLIINLVACLTLLSYYIFKYSLEMYQFVTILALFIPALMDIVLKIIYRKQGDNYFDEHHFVTMRVYMITVLPIFSGVHTGWYLYKHLNQINSCSLLIVFLLCFLLVNVFIKKYLKYPKRTQDLDNTVNLVVYMIILGLILIIR